ncbi:TPA: hypothetical protein LWJ61_002810, partial [Listeria innocua]|nr:hypothetical protein [Listeria innocua]HBM3881013.1 hypothetical protein [Listeria innocua]
MANLKKLFPEFYQENINKNYFTDKADNIIILDTNYLLEVIKSPTIVSKQYVEAIEKVKKNIYIPYLVALEFNFNKSTRKKIKIYEIDNYKSNIITNIKKVKEKIEDIPFINSDNKEAFTKEILALTKTYSEDIQSLIDTTIQSMVTNEQEELYSRLITIIENSIGDPYTQKWIESIEEEGKTRFEGKIPPGFDDTTKDNSEDSVRRYGGLSYHKKFGDLLIWKDIIEFSKKSIKQGKKVIFVTDDGKSKSKKDLLYKVRHLTVGPNIYLMNELQKEAQKELYIIDNLRFIQLVNNLSDEQVNELKININNQYKNNKHFYGGSMLNKELNYLVHTSSMNEEEKANFLDKINHNLLSRDELDSIYEFLITQHPDKKRESYIEKENTYDNLDDLEVTSQEYIEDDKNSEKDNRNSKFNKKMNRKFYFFD